MAALVLGACGGDERAEGSPPSAPPSPAAPEPLAVDGVAAPEPGRARVVLGARLDADLEVVTCTRALGAEPDGEVPSEQVVVEATGEVDGDLVALSVRRYRSQGASPTITDTVRVVRGPSDAPTAVLEAQRFEVDGLVTDPRDADATAPLLRITGDRIEAEALFAAPGAFADDGGLVAGVVHIACEG